MSSTNCGRCAVRADSVHVRHASVEVQVQCFNVVIGVVLGELLVVRVVPIVVCDAVVRRTLVLVASLRSHCFHVAIFHVDFAVLEAQCLHTPSVTVDCRQLLPNFNCTAAN